MTKVTRAARNLFMWSYDRGTIQYDIICALILAFIFFMPPSCFVSKKSAGSVNSKQNASVSSPDGKTTGQRTFPNER
jgi:hypothetical protein